MAPWSARFRFRITARAAWILQSGDLLVCFTDGVTEPENEYGEMFGEDRLMDLVVRNAHRDEQEIIELVHPERAAMDGVGGVAGRHDHALSPTAVDRARAKPPARCSRANTFRGRPRPAVLEGARCPAASPLRQ